MMVTSGQGGVECPNPVSPALGRLRLRLCACILVLPGPLSLVSRRVSLCASYEAVAEWSRSVFEGLAKSSTGRWTREVGRWPPRLARGSVQSRLDP